MLNLKKKAYEAVKAYPKAKVFEDFHIDPFQYLQEKDMKFCTIECFVIIMYNWASIPICVSHARMDLCTKRSISMENIPLSKHPLLLHVKRAIYQAGIWAKTLEPQQQLPSPQNFGSKEKRGRMWEPVWMTQPPAIKETREFVKCTFKGPCTRCKCFEADLPCTGLCSCKCIDVYNYDEESEPD